MAEVPERLTMMNVVVAVRNVTGHSIASVEDMLYKHLLKHGLRETDDVTVTLAPTPVPKVAIAGAPPEMDTIALAYEASTEIAAILASAPKRMPSTPLPAQGRR